MPALRLVTKRLLLHSFESVVRQRYLMTWSERGSKILSKSNSTDESIFLRNGKEGGGHPFGVVCKDSSAGCRLHWTPDSGNSTCARRASWWVGPSFRDRWDTTVLFHRLNSKRFPLRASCRTLNWREIYVFADENSNCRELTSWKSFSLNGGWVTLRWVPRLFLEGEPLTPLGLSVLCFLTFFPFSFYFITF